MKDPFSKDGFSKNVKSSKDGFSAGGLSKGGILKNNLSNDKISKQGISKNGLALLLTAREKQILKLLTDGCTNKEIAKKLTISVRTVEVHRKNIMHKLEI